MGTAVMVICTNFVSRNTICLHTIVTLCLNEILNHMQYIRPKEYDSQKRKEYSDRHCGLDELQGHYVK